MEQGQGSTLYRQIEHCQGYVTEKGWTLAGEPLLDKGRSAYSGDNIKSGSLGQFAKRVASGAHGENVHLIVEELDRLSRQPPDVMLAWMSPLIRSGLTIHVTQTHQVIDARMLDHDMGGLLMLLVGAFGSHSESRKKAERVGKAWAAKREKAREGETVQRNHRHPMWIRVSDDGSFQSIPERAAVIRQIFKRRLEGAGKLLIAKELNVKGVQTWAATKKQASVNGGPIPGHGGGVKAGQ